MANSLHGIYIGNDKLVFSTDDKTITKNGVKYTKGDGAVQNSDGSYTINNQKFTKEIIGKKVTGLYTAFMYTFQNNDWNSTGWQQNDSSIDSGTILAVGEGSDGTTYVLIDSCNNSTKYAQIWFELSDLTLK